MGLLKYRRWDRRHDISGFGSQKERKQTLSARQRNVTAEGAERNHRACVAERAAQRSRSLHRSAFATGSFSVEREIGAHHSAECVRQHLESGIARKDEPDIT